jgi:hypothetical protein
MTSFEVVKGEPDDDELAALVAAVTIISGRRKAATTRNAGAVSAWRQVALTAGVSAAPTGIGSWRQSFRRR